MRVDRDRFSAAGGGGGMRELGFGDGGVRAEVDLAALGACVK
jgi:hypothetical protein